MKKDSISDSSSDVADLEDGVLVSPVTRPPPTCLTTRILPLNNVNAASIETDV